MAKIETYDRLFADITSAVLSVIPDKVKAAGLAKIILRSKPAILKKYLTINNHVKAEYMIDGQEKLDRHKCGACFMVAFEKGLIIMGCDKEYERYREKIAMLAAMTILASFTENDAKKHGNYAMIEHINAHDGLVLPSASRDQKSFEEVWAMSLRRIYTGSQEIDAVLSISKDLFLIEKYNEAMVEVRG